MSYDFRNQWFRLIYRLLGINRGNVWVIGVNAPREDFAALPVTFAHIFDPDIVRKLPTGIIQKFFS